MEKSVFKKYHLYGVMNGIDRDWGSWGSRQTALHIVDALCDGNYLLVDKEFYRDDPHKHQQVLVCTDGRSRFFIDRVIC